MFHVMDQVQRRWALLPFLHRRQRTRNFCTPMWVPRKVISRALNSSQLVAMTLDWTRSHLRQWIPTICPVWTVSTSNITSVNIGILMLLPNRSPEIHSKCWWNQPGFGSQLRLSSNYRFHHLCGGRQCGSILCQGLESHDGGANGWQSPQSFRQANVSWSCCWFLLTILINFSPQTIQASKYRQRYQSINGLQCLHHNTENT